MSESSISYWKEKQATLHDILGGQLQIANTDILNSHRFLQKAVKAQNKSGVLFAYERSADVGAGIGRVTAGVLQKCFKHVDLYEPVDHLLQEAKRLTDQTKCSYYCSSIAQFISSDAVMYNCVWLQWVLMYADDTQVVALLSACRQKLQKNGVIIVKENYSESNEVEVDAADFSTCRPLARWQKLFERSQCKILLWETVPHWPDRLYKIFAAALVL
uniref:Alpha N-terminal protein methyltransferase 1 n=1 Tax=Dermatophagoides pteronyssinus TaxID=6956 RepID=A0A6P6YJJ1_DERPT|nr:N-terminal Xaa-Pro-Lys N-methyltransferase 1-B-like [Dermatophagoides pteronyssinus]